ncbi:MAG: hypothetical protein CL942_00435 [Desulfovibrio sp.]|nr:hypothetical protein [Desulfovibrio sp.]
MMYVMNPGLLTDNMKGRDIKIVFKPWAQYTFYHRLYNRAAIRRLRRLGRLAGLRHVRHFVQAAEKKGKPPQRTALLDTFEEEALQWSTRSFLLFIPR